MSMRRLSRALMIVLGLVSAAGPLAAQTKSTPDDVYEQAMSHWRAATWYSHLGDPNITAIEIDTLVTTWQAVAALPDGQRPSLYQKDPDWPRTVAEVSKLIVDAANATDANDSKAAASLEKIGDDLAAARQRVGTAGFSDAVRRYHAAVERLSGLASFAGQSGGAPFDDKRRAEVQQATAACLSAAAALTGAIPPRWVDDTKLKSLISQTIDGVKAVQTELARHASGREIAAAINVVRSNYALLFLNYG
jgi:hypothetical protein